MSRSQPDYDVGYKKPPRTSQFQKGQSGNPKGRPKGSLSLAAALERTLREKVVIRENGRSYTLSKLDVALKQLSNKAAGGDLAALRLLTALISQIPPPEIKTATAEQVQGEDQQVLARLTDRLRRATHQNLIQALNQENPSEPPAPESEPGGTPGPVPE